MSAVEGLCWDKIMMQCGYIDSDTWAGMQSQDSEVDITAEILLVWLFLNGCLNIAETKYSVWILQFVQDCTFLINFCLL